MSATQLPKLIDRAGLMRELGVKHATAEAIMRQLPKVEIPGVRKTYVRRVDVDRLLNDSTVAA